MNQANGSVQRHEVSLKITLERLSVRCNQVVRHSYRITTPLITAVIALRNDAETMNLAESTLVKRNDKFA